MLEQKPRIIFAGLSGDSGKTITSLSFLSHYRQKAPAVRVFKKGPDYIDSAWLSHFAGSPCHNLDTYLAGEVNVYRSFCSHSTSNGISVIEGNRGLFDGLDVDGTHSTAGLAKLLKAPVVLIADATKATRTIAALVKGCIDFDPDVNIVGVILNRVAGERHKKIIIDSIEKYCGLPVLGAIPKLDRDGTIIPSRHLGLVTPSEFDRSNALGEKLYEIADKYLNMEGIVRLANNAPQLDIEKTNVRTELKPNIKIGYFKDSAFTFYYPENLEALRANGAELIEISSMTSSSLPDIDGLYIGGGFPETQGEKISNNLQLLASLKEAAEDGLPIYAECGGLILLCRSLCWQDNTYRMAGVFPIDLAMHKRPIGHGYTALEADTTNPIFAMNSKICGHEFHYSSPLNFDENITTCMKVEKGTGLGNNRDGLIYKNCLAVYTHIHADGHPEWAERFCRLVRSYKNGETDFFEINSPGAPARAGAV